MAQTEHLPIYKSAYDLCLYFEQVVRNFSRFISITKTKIQDTITNCRMIHYHILSLGLYRLKC